MSDPFTPPTTPADSFAKEIAHNTDAGIPGPSNTRVLETEPEVTLNSPAPRSRHHRNAFSSFKPKRNLPIRKALRRYNPQMSLENSGSTARDHLASERTFLAYVRTSLALTSTGVALVQLFAIADITSRGTGTPLSDASSRLQKFARPLGVTTILLALILLVIAMYRYFIVQRALPENQFPVARFSVAFVGFALGAVVVVIFSTLLGGVTR